MDPKVWGSKLWNIIFDICWMLEKRGNRLPKKTTHSTAILVRFLSSIFGFVKNLVNVFFGKILCKILFCNFLHSNCFLKLFFA